MLEEYAVIILNVLKCLRTEAVADCCEHCNEHSRYIKHEYFFTGLVTLGFSKRIVLHELG
jgi:hypothetical protein